MRLHYFRFWRELRQVSLTSISHLSSSCTISVSEGNYDHSSTASFTFSISSSSCTISVSEGNYDRDAFTTICYNEIMCCTISVSEGNYDNNVIMLKITSFIFQLHYFRFWRELRHSLLSPFNSAEENSVALFPFLKGITTLIFCFFRNPIASS